MKVWSTTKIAYRSKALLPILSPFLPSSLWSWRTQRWAQHVLTSCLYSYFLVNRHCKWYLDGNLHNNKHAAKNKARSHDLPATLDKQACAFPPLSNNSISGVRQGHLCFSFLSVMHSHRRADLLRAGREVEFQLEVLGPAAGWVPTFTKNPRGRLKSRLVISRILFIVQTV